MCDSGPQKSLFSNPSFTELLTDRAVRWRRNIFLLTRLAFRLTSAPVIRTKIVKRILSQDDILNKAVFSYIDDIFVDEGLLKGERSNNVWFVGTRSKRTRKIALSYRYPDSWFEDKELGWSLDQK